MTQPPRRFRFMWRDGVFVPENSIAEYCDSEFGEGEIVTLSATRIFQRPPATTTMPA